MAIKEVQRAPLRVDREVFGPALEDFLIELARENGPRNRDGFISPSSVMGCKTRAVHQLNGEPMKLDPVEAARAKPLLEIATLIHEYYQDYGMKAGILVDCEKVVEIPEWKVKGQIDGILKARQAEDRRRIKKYLFELKTCNTHYFGRVMNTRKPLPHQIPQNMVYLKATGMDATRFFYVGRENPSAMQFEVVQELDPVVMAQVEEWIGSVLEHHSKGTYPPAEEVGFDPDSNQCMQCPYLATKCMAGVYKRQGIHLLA